MAKVIMRKWCVVLAIGLLSLVLASCATAPETTAKSTVQLNLGAEPPTLDPIKVTDLTSLSVVNQLMVGLTRFDETSQLVPGLAMRWQVSPDGRQYTFWLNPAARWHDGLPVTAQHVVHGLQRALTASNGSEYAFFLFPLKNAKAFYEGKISGFQQVGVKALSAGCVQLQLTQPVAFFPALLAFPVAYPARLDRITRHGDQWTEAGHFVGNGPYRLSSWRHDDRISLMPVSPYWGKAALNRPPVDMLMFNDTNTSMVLYENQQLDMVESPTSLPGYEIRRVKQRPDYRQSQLAVIHYIGMNQQKPPFNNPLVRQALALATDKQTLAKVLQTGQTPLNGFVVPGMPGYDPAIGLSFNPVKARALLTQAGYPDGKGFPVVTLAFRDVYDVRKECEVLQYLWQKHLGIAVRLQSMDWKILLNQLKTDAPPLFKLNWYVDYPDPDSFLSLFTTDNGNNYTRWHNPQYDKQVAQAAAMPNGPARAEAYKALQRLLLQQHSVIVPTYTLKKSLLVSPRVTGLAVNSLNMLDLWQLQLKPST
jgi:oligopeptide transport system substrate-binding protein